MIYICIPAYDEERTIGVLLWKIRKVMLEFEREFEVLVLDDTSTDGTAQVLERYEGSLPLRVIRPEEHLGYGSALQRLLEEVVKLSPYPKRDVAVTLQADFTEDPADLVTMVKKIEGGADLVAGHPSFPDGLDTPNRISRWLAPRLLGRAFRAAPVSDPLTGFRAYRVIVLKKALREVDRGKSLVETDGWAANLELLSTVAPHARRIEEAPVQIHSRRRERVSRFQVIPVLRGLLGLRKTSWPSDHGSTASESVA